MTLGWIVGPFIELNKRGKFCVYGGELHLGYVEFEVPVERTSGDEGSISDAQEGDMGVFILLRSLEVITQGVRGKEHLDENAIEC